MVAVLTVDFVGESRGWECCRQLGSFVKPGRLQMDVGTNFRLWAAYQLETSVSYTRDLIAITASTSLADSLLAPSGVSTKTFGI